MTYDLTTTTTTTTRARALSLAGALGCALLCALSLGACDSPKNIGDETTTDGGCTPGDEMPADDGCNTCTCQDDGTWACTEIGCEPTVGSTTIGGECTPGDEMLDIDECGNYCTCEPEGTWACSNIGCEPMCEPGDTKPAGDGCNTCVCDDYGGWGCSEKGCEVPELTVCQGDEASDEVTITGGTLDGDIITLEVEYGGGCEAHALGGCWDENFDLSEPPGAGFTLWHDAMGDGCEALIHEQVLLSLVPMKLAYQNGNPDLSGTIIVNVGGYPESFEYNF